MAVFTSAVSPRVLGILWLARDTPTESPYLTSMDEGNGIQIELFPEAEERFIRPLAQRDKEISISIISTYCLTQLGLPYVECNRASVKDKSQTIYSPIGKTNLEWRKINKAKQFSETFYVVEGDTPLVILGKTASPQVEENPGAELTPLELSKQTPEERQKQELKRAQIEQQREKERKEQEERDAKKRANPAPK